MCRWGCITIDTVKIIKKNVYIIIFSLTIYLSKTYACKWCGTRFCAECLRGDFHGEMKGGDSLKCRKCKQVIKN